MLFFYYQVLQFVHAESLNPSVAEYIPVDLIIAIAADASYVARITAVLAVNNQYKRVFSIGMDFNYLCHFSPTT